MAFGEGEIFLYFCCKVWNDQFFDVLLQIRFYKHHELFYYELCLIGCNIDTSFQITITTNAPKQIYYFLYGGFIGKDVGKGHLYREIFAKKSLPKEVTTGIYCRYVNIYISSSDDVNMHQNMICNPFIHLIIHNSHVGFSCSLKEY